jgi:hypothetical protein
MASAWPMARDLGYHPEEHNTALIHQTPVPRYTACTHQMANGTQGIKKRRKRDKTINHFNFYGSTQVELAAGSHISLKKILSNLLDEKLKEVLSRLSLFANDETRRSHDQPTSLSNHRFEADTPGRAESLTAGSGPLYSPRTGSTLSEPNIFESKSRIPVVLDARSSCPPCRAKEARCIIPFRRDGEIKCERCNVNAGQCEINERAVDFIDMHRCATRHIQGDLDSMFPPTSSEQITAIEVHQLSPRSLDSAFSVDPDTEKYSCPRSRPPSHSSRRTPEGDVAPSIEAHAQMHPLENLPDEARSGSSRLRLTIPDISGSNVSSVRYTDETSV